MNAINWFEIPVRDLDKATPFYAAVLGIELKRELFFGVPHAIFLAEGVAGALIQDAQRAPAAPQTGGSTLYLHAQDGVSACLARAIEAGGRVVRPLTAIGPFGTIALIADLDGNVVGLHAPAAAATGKAAS
jgi:predicted enzyme related to lactoylglutathione lyase